MVRDCVPEKEKKGNGLGKLFYEFYLPRVLVRGGLFFDKLLKFLCQGIGRTLKEQARPYHSLNMKNTAPTIIENPTR